MAGVILLALSWLLELPYLLYWILWLPLEGPPPKHEQQPGYERASLRLREIWALKTVAVTYIVVGIYGAATFFWAR
jgi:hypothetical protein